MRLKSIFVAFLIMFAMISTAYAAGADGPIIDSVRVSNGGEKGYIDNDDTILVSYDEDIDINSIGSDIKVSVSSDGIVTVEDVASFDMGDVSRSGEFDTTAHKDGDNIRLTLKEGDKLKIQEEDFGGVTQIAGTVENEDGVAAGAPNDLSEPVGTFGGVQTTTSSSSDSGSSDVGDVWGIQPSNEGFTDLANVETMGGVYMGFTPFRNLSLLSIAIIGGLAITAVIGGTLLLLGMAGIGGALPNVKRGWDLIRGAQGKIVAIGLVFALALFNIVVVFFTLTIFGQVISYMA